MIIEPKISDNLNEVHYLKNVLTNEELICGALMQNEEEYNIVKEDIEINSSKLKNVKFISCSFEKSYFVDVIFENCDLSNINLSKSTFKKVIFKDCKLNGANFTESYFENVTFDNCNARTIYLDQSSIYSTKFNESILKDSSISYVNFKYIEIYKSDFTLCNFSKSKLNGLDFSNSIIDGIIVYNEDLKGVVMNEMQALSFVKLLGIKIKN